MHKPRRIVSLLSSATEILYGLGLDHRTVAIGHECDYPPQWADKPRVTVSHLDSSRPSHEIDSQVQQLMEAQSALYSVDRAALVNLKPDLVITQDQCDVCAVRLDDVLQVIRSTPELHQTQVLALNPNSLDEVLHDIHRIGIATDAQQAAATWIEQLEQRIARVRSIADKMPKPTRPRTICIEWTQPLMLAANWTPQIIEWAGGANGPTIGGEHSQYCDWNEVLQFDPELIVVAPCGFDLDRTIVEAVTLQGLPGWQQLTAVQTNRVIAVDGNAYFNRSGPRLVDTLEILASLMHPDRFPPVHSHAVQCLSSG